MNLSTIGTRRAALAALALAVVVSCTLAGAAIGAEQQQVDAAKKAGTVLVSAPAQIHCDRAGTWDDKEGCGNGTGTTDGDPDIPMDCPRAPFDLLIIRTMVLLAALGL